MKREEFEQQLQAIVPRPSPEMTASLYELGLNTSEDAGPQDILNTFDFIARNFDQEVLQSIYEISHHGPAILPSEMVTIAVLLQDGDTLDDILSLIKSGRLKPL